MYGNMTPFRHEPNYHDSHDPGKSRNPRGINHRNPETSQRIDSRYLDIYLEKDNKKYKTVPISRRFLSRLTQANETILRYRAAPSAKGLAECVKKLESLSFEDVALQLEERELKAHPDFRREFEQAFE